jgi:hypothetical protein
MDGSRLRVLIPESSFITEQARWLFWIGFIQKIGLRTGPAKENEPCDEKDSKHD